MSTRNLSDLIRQYQEESGESYREIADRAGLSFQRIAQLAMQTNQSAVRKDTVSKLAKGLRQPLHVVQTAAAVSAGIATPEITEPEIAETIERMRKLSPANRAIVSDIVRVVYRHQVKRHDEDR